MEPTADPGSGFALQHTVFGFTSLQLSGRLKIRYAGF